jgi:maltooligosyltrehalose trehalohydrolase
MSAGAGATHRHAMPFGAEVVDGGVRFALWAPRAQSVDVLLHGQRAPRVIPMAARADGWFEVVTAQAVSGSRYKFRIDATHEVPDPAARASLDVHGPSVVVDPRSYAWRAEWRGRPWHEAVIYELHAGTFTPEGTFAALTSRLDHLVDLGVTFVELMPVAEFPGSRGWGYDGVLPFAPESAYGEPEALKALVDAAHAKGLAVLLDVVYNHFGPEGNWLRLYAPDFFTHRHHTPWGDAINFDGDNSATVREFFIQNALYWLEEYQFDGLRLDAVHAICDDSPTHFVHELAQRMRDGPGRDRHVHLVLENHANSAGLLGAPGAPDTADAQWSDDSHHCLHVILTGERDGYYVDYADDPHRLLARCLTQGFAYQGEPSHYGGGKRRGEPSGHLPATAFVNFLQNHDMIGNRAFGERLHTLVEDDSAVLAAAAIVLLAPSPPMLFMGEEWAAPEAFTFFCDFEADLAAKVREGRRREFASFASFRDEGGHRALPDPTDIVTFVAAKLDWTHLTKPPHAAHLDRHRRLLAIRRQFVTPLIPGLGAGRGGSVPRSTVIDVSWPTDDGRRLRLVANLSATRSTYRDVPSGRPVYATHASAASAPRRDSLDPWSVAWWLEPDT